jgi:arabinan endo-1,5-alpha-L-arabinosidase
LFLLCLAFGLAAANGTYTNPVVAQSLPDPTIIRAADGYFYLYATEDTRNTPIYRSSDLVNWTFQKTAFTNSTRPTFEPSGGIWAPDINYINGKYVLYYSMSVWGGEQTCGIGVATAQNPQGPFTDLGKLFRSNEISVQNSIDPFYIEDNGKKYLFWGSFHGIYYVELSDDGLSLKNPDDPQPKQVAGTAFEGTYILKRGNYYYLFASVGSCCDGLNSTYKLVVGRSQSLFGPYVNKPGSGMMSNNYTMVVGANDRFVGNGHCSEIVQDDAGNDWMLFHGWDKNNAGNKRVLLLNQLKWDNEKWPYVEENSPAVSAEEPFFTGQYITQKFYIDFGQDNPNEGRNISALDNNGNYWNNVVAPNGSPSTLNAGYTVQLKSSANQSTDYVLEVARTIRSNGGANGGLATPDPALLGDLAVGTATQDYFFLDGGMGKGLFKFKNLDTGKAYKFHIYGCRTAAGNQRGVIYSLSGKNGSHGKQLNTGTGIGENGYDGNNNNVWVSAPVVPAGNGEIMLELGRLFSGEMAYISALKIEEYGGITLPEAEKRLYIDFGMNNNGLDGLPTASPDANQNYWNNIGPAAGIDGPTNQVTVGTSIPLVASDNTATGYTLETGSLMAWNGVRNGALGGTDSPNEPTPALLGDLAVKTATYDYLFINDNATAVLNFKNLNSNKQYRFHIFGSRKDDGSEGRIGRIEIAGTNTITGIHQMGGAGTGANGESYNNKNIFVSDLITPAAGGRITLTMTRWLGMAHINCIRLEEYAGTKATAISIAGDNSITQCGRYIQLSVVPEPQGTLLPAVVWSVDNEDLARITETGRLYAKGNGTVTVTATPEEDVTLATSKTISISGQNIAGYSFTVMGSSVPWGQGAEPRDVNGYAWLWTSYLQNHAAHAWTTNNISIGGNTTTDVTNRWDSDLLPSCSRYVYYGLSLGNEGIHEKGQSAFNSWRDNMLTLIERTRSHGKIPIVGNNYPRGDFNTADYTFVKQLNLLIHEWDVPSVNLLGAIDDGYGQWASGYMADNAHPNTAGHAELFYVIVPSLLDAVAGEKPQPLRAENTSLTLEKTDIVKRVSFTPEGTLHSFTLSFAFKTTGTGTIASFVTAAGDTARLILNSAGKLTYKTQTSIDALNDANWHTATLTHYYAGGRTQLCIDGARIPRSTLINEKLVPVKFILNDFDNAPQSVDYRELFFYRAGMCAEEIQALYDGKMLKSSLEIYAPLDGSAATEQEILENRAQSLNAPVFEEREILTGLNEINLNRKGEIKEIAIYSLTGQRLFHTTNPLSGYKVKLPAGVYIAKVLTTQGVETQLRINN